MKLPIDTTTLKFAAAGPAELVLDYGTKTPKTDENGVPLYSVLVFAAGSGINDSIPVKVAGEPRGLDVFTLIKITGLIAQTWEVGPNHGVSFRAEKVEVLKASA